MINKNDLRIKSVEQNIEFAKAEVHEEGNNGGEFINKIESIWGLKNEPYCAMGQFWNFAKSYLILKNIQFTEKNICDVIKKYKLEIFENTLSFDPLVANMVNLARRRKQFFSFKKTSDLAKGDFVIYDFGNAKISAHHIEQFVYTHNGHIVTVGWNTSSSNSTIGNDPTGGGGVFVKERSLENIIGIIKW